MATTRLTGAVVLLLALLYGASAASKYWEFEATTFTSKCSPRSSTFGFLFTLNSTAPSTGAAIVLQLGKSWNISGIAYDSTTGITGLRFSLDTLAVGSSKTLSLTGVGRTYANTAPLTYAVVLTDGTVRYGYIRTGGPWPYPLAANPSKVTMNMTVYDFGISGSNKKNADFERTTGTFTSSERNISSLVLLSDRVPNYYHCYPSTSCTSVSSNTTFQQWFRSSSANKVLSTSVTFTEVSGSEGLYSYSTTSFFPIDGQGYGNEGYSHNYGYCMAFHGSFQYRVGDVFSFSGDDDVFAYIDNKRVIDLGGIHTTESASVSLDTLSLSPGEAYSFDFFYCERHTELSTFSATTTLTFDECGTDPCGYCVESCATSEGGNDTDGDSYWDCMDACPYDASKRFPGECGCGKNETCSAALQESSEEPAVVVESSSPAVVAESSAPDVTESSSPAVESSTPAAAVESSEKKTSQASSLGAALALLVCAAASAF